MVKQYLLCAVGLACLGLFASPVAAQVSGVLIWEYYTTEGVYASTGIPDVDGDGYPDVAAAIYYINPGSDLYCVSGASGSLIWEKSDCLGTWGNKSLASIPDLNGNGFDDVILGTPGGSYPGTSVIAKDGETGETIWYNDAPPGWVYSVARMPDVNGDSVSEVIAGSGSFPTTFCFDGVTGTILWSFEPDYGQACWNVAPIGDVNSSGVADVIVGGEGWAALDRPGLFVVEGGTGDTIWSRVVDESVMDVSSFNDFDGDGVEEVIAGAWTDSVYCLAGVNGKLFWSTGVGNPVQEVVSIDDVNGDTLDDVLVGSWASSVYCLDGRTGAVLWSTPVGLDCWSVAALPDISGDGIQDAVVGAVNGRRVLCVSGADGSPIWDYYSRERVYDVSSIDDVNGDGLADVLVGLQDQGNAVYHLLCFDGDANLGVEEDVKSQIPMTNYQFLACYPNPFGHTTTIHYSLPSAVGGRLTAVNLLIYDGGGRLVRTLIDTPSNYATMQLSNQVVWDGKDNSGQRVPAGIYFIRLRVGDLTTARRAVLIS